MIEALVSESLRACHLSSSRRQISNRINGGLAEFIQLYSLQCLVDGLTRTGASQPQLDVISVVYHGVLAA